MGRSNQCRCVDCIKKDVSLTTLVSLFKIPLTSSSHCFPSIFLRTVQMKELEEEFEKLPPGPPVPTRLLRSQQAVAQTTPSGGGAETGGQEGSMYFIIFQLTSQRCSYV